MEADLPNDDAFQDRVRALLRLIRPMKALSGTKKRYGRDWDGGYVMLDTLEQARICYSLGISDDVSWDLCMAEFGSEVFMYDHTVPAPPQRHPRFHFRPIGIGPNDQMAANLRRLETMVRDNRHDDESGMILKMDIEGHEWDCFAGIDPGILARFDQIVCEFHSMYRLRQPSWLARAEEAFAKLHTGHQVIHVHGNNNGDMVDIAGLQVPGYFELTLASRGRHQFEPTDEVFPTELDMPCTPARPELVLGNFAY